MARTARSDQRFDGTRGWRARPVRTRKLLVALGVVVLCAASTALGALWAPLGADVAPGLIAGAGVVAGALAVAVIAYLILPLVERFTGLTTRTRLLELSNPSHPLMRELMDVAPGTYSHSMLAGNLAETAAGAIGGDQLLARVGAYYHDIGKMRRPVFFAENQMGAINPHDEASPVASARIITGHVREGVQIAEEYKLPSAVVDIIEQHHGDSLVACFFDKAVGFGPVTEEDFRYHGRSPRSREAALVMLADIAEAAVRCLGPAPYTKVESTVRRVVEMKRADGQLVQSRLSESDIDKVVRVYAKMLSSIYHPRVTYPDAAPKRKQHERQHHQPSRP